jgi:hypothetical protein
MPGADKAISAMAVINERSICICDIPVSIPALN